MKPSEVLEKAADIVDVRWRQDGLGEAGERRCAVGAIHEATAGGEGEMLPSVGQDAVRFVERFVLSGDVVHFNDTLGRTAAEVSAKLREAAAKAREAGQ